MTVKLSLKIRSNVSLKIVMSILVLMVHLWSCNNTDYHEKRINELSLYLTSGSSIYIDAVCVNDHNCAYEVSYEKSLLRNYLENVESVLGYPDSACNNIERIFSYELKSNERLTLIFNESFSLNDIIHVYIVSNDGYCFSDGNVTVESDSFNHVYYEIFYR